MEAIKALALWVMFGRTSPDTDPQEEFSSDEQGQGATTPLEVSADNVERIDFTADGEERRIRML